MGGAPVRRRSFAPLVPDPASPGTDIGAAASHAGVGRVSPEDAFAARRYTGCIEVGVWAAARAGERG